jgi:hypothetical protein
MGLHLLLASSSSIQQQKFKDGVMFSSFLSSARKEAKEKRLLLISLCNFLQIQYCNNTLVLGTYPAVWLSSQVPCLICCTRLVWALGR